MSVPAAVAGPSGKAQEDRRNQGSGVTLGREEESGGVAQREEGRGVPARVGVGGGRSVFAERWGNR